MANYDEILQLAQRLEHEARGLKPTNVLLPRPHPTLRTQSKKFDDMEISSAFSARVGGHVPAARVNLRHKKSEELALHSLREDYGPITDGDSEEDILPDVNSTVDDVVARAHVRSLKKSLERSQQGKAEAAKRLHWAHDEADFNVATARLSELSSIRRTLQMQGRPLRLRAGTLGRGPTTYWGCEGPSNAPKEAATGDWRSSDYKRVVEEWMRVPDAERAATAETTAAADDEATGRPTPTWGGVVDMFKQLVGKGPHGARDGPDAGRLLDLWDSVAAVVHGATRKRAAGVARQDAMADAARAYLEAQYSRHLLSSEAAPPPAAGSAPPPPTAGHADILHSLALSAHQRDPNRMGYPEPVFWLEAFLALRAGEVGCARDCLTASGNVDAVRLAAEVPQHWPPYTAEGGALTERPPSAAAKTLAAQLTAYDYEADPFRCAVVLLLSRSATVADQAALWHQLSKREVTQYVQDRIWLNLALCASPAHGPDDKAAKAKGQPQAYRLAQLQVQASHAKVGDFPDAVLYVQAMLWSVCVPMAVHALVPPTMLDAFADCAMEGLHVALLLMAARCVDDDACAQRVHRALGEYIGKLVPFHAGVATLYMRLMPNAAEALLTAICTNTDACHALLGYIGLDQQVHEGAAVDIFPDAEQRAQVILSIGNALCEGGRCVFLASEVLLVALGVGGEVQVIRSLVGHLKASLMKVVAELDGHGTQHDSSVEVLRALEMAAPHLEKYEATVGEIRSLRHLHALVLLCCAVTAQNPSAWDFIARLTSFGLFPGTVSDVPRCASEVNTQCEVSSVRTALPVAISMALSAIAQELQSPSSQALGPIKRHLVSTGKALSLYATQLRVPVSLPTTNRLQAAKVSLSQVA